MNEPLPDTLILVGVGLAFFMAWLKFGNPKRGICFFRRYHKIEGVFTPRLAKLSKGEFELIYVDKKGYPLPCVTCGKTHFGSRFYERVRFRLSGEAAAKALGTK